MLRSLPLRRRLGTLARLAASVTKDKKMHSLHSPLLFRSEPLASAAATTLATSASCAAALDATIARCKITVWRKGAIESRSTTTAAARAAAAAAAATGELALTSTNVADTGTEGAATTISGGGCPYHGGYHRRHKCSCR